MMKSAKIAAIATANPPYTLEKDKVIEYVRRIYQNTVPDIDSLVSVYENAKIDRRYCCTPMDWFLSKHSFKEKNDLYIESALNLLAEVSIDCIEKAKKKIEDIDEIVFISTTGIATPSIDALLLEKLNFRRDVVRTPIFGLGCAGGVTGLARAAKAAEQKTGRNVLLLCVELCSLTFQLSDSSKANLVSTALFGDGASAILLNTEAEGPSFISSYEYSWKNSLNYMGWKVDDKGFSVQISPEIPRHIAEKIRPVLLEYLAKEEIDLNQIDTIIPHPGGTKVLQALQSSLPIATKDLKIAADILKNYGNMSAVTVHFILQKSLNEKKDSENMLLTSVGPGFTASFARLKNN